MGVMHIPGHTHQAPREVALEEIEAVLGDCHLCQLYQSRHSIVFGVGNPHARVMFIGEAPGRNEDLQGEPFVGAAGQFLDEMLSIIGLSRRNCYIANIVKCRPPQNRDPRPAERECCRPWLNAQIELLRPKLIVCLGRIAAMEFIDPEFRITREHGKWFEINGTWRMAMFHPSALLRDPDKRPETFRDLKALQKMVTQHCPNTVLED